MAIRRGPTASPTKRSFTSCLTATRQRAAASPIRAAGSDVSISEWETFLTTNDLEAFAIGIGNGVGTGSLAPIAYPNTGGPDADGDRVIVVERFRCLGADEHVDGLGGRDIVDQRQHPAGRPVLHDMARTHSAPMAAVSCRSRWTASPIHTIRSATTSAAAPGRACRRTRPFLRSRPRWAER